MTTIASQDKISTTIKTWSLAYKISSCCRLGDLSRNFKIISFPLPVFLCIILLDVSNHSTGNLSIGRPSSLKDDKFPIFSLMIITTMFKIKNNVEREVRLQPAHK